MPICRYLDESGSPQYALHQADRICPLARFVDDAPVEFELFDRGADWVTSLQAPPDSVWIPAPVTFLPPVPRPEKIFCIGLNYRDHAIETGAEIPTEPVVFSKFNSTMIGV